MAIQGTDEADTLFATSEGGLIAGRGGNDIIYGFIGDDRIYGGDGDDYIHGGGGQNTLWGKQGNDYIDGGEGLSFAYGGAGNDVLIACRDTGTISGQQGDDTLVLVDGEARGDAGNDVIHAMDWSDFGWLNSEMPTLLYGGRGADLFHMGFRDGTAAYDAHVMDFRPGQGDRLLLDVYADDNALLFDDATTKALLDTNDDGWLTDADGDPVNLPGWDVAYTFETPQFDAGGFGLKIQIGNDYLMVYGTDAIFLG